MADHDPADPSPAGSCQGSHQPREGAPCRLWVWAEHPAPRCVLGTAGRRALARLSLWSSFKFQNGTGQSASFPPPPPLLFLTSGRQVGSTGLRTVVNTVPSWGRSDSSAGGVFFQLVMGKTSQQTLCCIFLKFKNKLFLFPFHGSRAGPTCVGNVLFAISRPREGGEQGNP